VQYDGGLRKGSTLEIARSRRMVDPKDIAGRVVGTCCNRVPTQHRASQEMASQAKVMDTTWQTTSTRQEKRVGKDETAKEIRGL
jgi:hypothetical protein